MSEFNDSNSIYIFFLVVFLPICYIALIQMIMFYAKQVFFPRYSRPLFILWPFRINWQACQMLRAKKGWESVVFLQVNLWDAVFTWNVKKWGKRACWSLNVSKWWLMRSLSLGIYSRYCFQCYSKVIPCSTNRWFL